MPIIIALFLSLAVRVETTVTNRIRLHAPNGDDNDDSI